MVMKGLDERGSAEEGDRHDAQARIPRRAVAHGLLFLLSILAFYRVATTRESLKPSTLECITEGHEADRGRSFSHNKTAQIEQQPKEKVIYARRSSPYLDFDPNYTQTFTLADGSVVDVGRQASAIKRAVDHTLAQRMVGFPRFMFDHIETNVCLDPEGISTNMTLDKVKAMNLPQAILLGVQKGGTTALYQYLDQHPDVANCNKELYFLDEQVDTLVLKQLQHSGVAGIPLNMARSQYSTVMTGALQSPGAQNSMSREKPMVLDLTPNYLFESDRLPQRISCIVPWVKLFVLVRNPIHRARSQYDMKLRYVPQGATTNSKGFPLPSLREYIQNDLKALRETGVIQDWSKVDFDVFWDSPAMWEAWRTYLNSGLNAPVGMGLYAIQLKPFLDLPNDLLVIRSEDLEEETNKTFQDVLKFLELQSYSLPSYPRANNAKRKNDIPIDLVEELEQVFAPFNQKLTDLLGPEWKDTWA